MIVRRGGWHDGSEGGTVAFGSVSGECGKLVAGQVAQGQASEYYFAAGFSATRFVLCTGLLCCDCLFDFCRSLAQLLE